MRVVLASLCPVFKVFEFSMQRNFPVRRVRGKVSQSKSLFFSVALDKATVGFCDGASRMAGTTRLDGTSRRRRQAQPGVETGAEQVS